MINKKAVKIIIPILIIIIIIGIWFIKNKYGEPTSHDEHSQDIDLHVIEQLDLENLKSYGLPILIDFGADSCVPCKEMAPILVELHEQLHGKAIILFVDVWKYSELADGYPIKLIPTQIMIDSEGNPYNPSENLTDGMIKYSDESDDTKKHIFTTHEGGLNKEIIMIILYEMGLKE